MNPEKVKKYSKIANVNYSLTTSGIYKILKSNANRRNRKKDVRFSKEEFSNWYKKQEKKCYYCGITSDKLYLLPKIRRSRNLRLSIDRKNNSLGYLLTNIVLACNLCNTVKTDILSEQEMLKVGKIIGERWKNEF